MFVSELKERREVKTASALYRPPLLNGGEMKRTLTSTKLEQTALRAARAAGRIHLRRLGRVKVKPKTNPLDLVTEAGRESEQARARCG
jgi:hypothetical protein